MQGIFQGFKLMTHDTVWTVILDLALNEKTGISSIKNAYNILKMSGSANCIRE